MHNESEVAVLRYGHRPGHDDRMMTHIGLTARALGADRVILPDSVGHSMETVEDTTDRFGGPFGVKLAEALNDVIRNWEGGVVHLTMYDERVQDVKADIHEAHAEEPLLVAVGGKKIPFEVYEGADWNVGVTNQPYSEVAGLAVFLDRLFDGRGLDREWENAENRVVPMATGKKVVPADEEQSEHRRARLRFSAVRE